MSIIDENERIRRLIDDAGEPLRRLVEQRDLVEQLVKQPRTLAALHLPTEARFLSCATLSAAFDRRLDQLGSEASLMAQALSAVPDIQLAQARVAMGATRVEALLPDRLRLASVAQELAPRITPPVHTLLATEALRRRLARQMAAVTVPWVDVSAPALSFEGFAIASRLGAFARSKFPFSERAREQVDEDLGSPVWVDDDADATERDVAQVEAGMSVSLLAIAPAATTNVLVQCGFELASRYGPVPPTTDGSDPGLVFQPGNFGLVTFVEQHLRQFICTRMQAQYGGRWLAHKIAPNLVADWKYRQEQAVANGEPPLALIQYSNFMDLKDTIVRRDHWKEIFAAVFGKKAYFEVAMERLHSIRLPLAHARPIGTAQQIVLVAESQFVLGALGVNLLGGS